MSQQLFSLAPLAASDWLILMLATSPILLLVELEKALARRIQTHRNTEQAIAHVNL